MLLALNDLKKQYRLSDPAIKMLASRIPVVRMGNRSLVRSEDLYALRNTLDPEITTFAEVVLGYQDQTMER